MITNLMDQLVKLAYKLTELEKNPIYFGTDELLYPSEIHTIDAIGDQYDTVTEISKKFGITKGAVSQVIEKLHRKGYVHKVRNKAYSKEILLSLTEKGVTAYQAHKKLHQTMDVGMVQLIGGYSDEYLLTFQDMLIQLEKQVNKYIELGRTN